jgi:hypothetical protein
MNMGEFSPLHWLVALGFIFVIGGGVLWFTYRHGRKVGDQIGYVRGLKEGQQRP